MPRLAVATEFYYGNCRALRSGAIISAGKEFACDPADGLLEAWLVADCGTRCCMPFVDRVAPQGGTLVVIADLPVTGDLAWCAIELSDGATQ